LNRVMCVTLICRTKLHEISEIFKSFSYFLSQI